MRRLSILLSGAPLLFLGLAIHLAASPPGQATGACSAEPGPASRAADRLTPAR